MSVLRDAGDRERARLELGQNIIVEAGAGTGKTTLLIDRIVFLLLGGRPGSGPLDVTRLVALTFTEKAAAEIKFRLAERLNHLSSLMDGAEVPERERAATERCLSELEERFGRKKDELRSLAAGVLRDLEWAQIGTIHSFCAHLLRLYPLEAGVDPEFRVDADESALEELFEAQWAAWLDVELGQSPPRPGEWKRVLETASLADLESLARGLLGPRVDLDAARAQPGVKERLEKMALRSREIGRGQPKAKGKIQDYLEWIAEQFEAAAKGAEGREPPAKSVPKWPSAWDEADRTEYEQLAAAAKALDPTVERLYADAVALLQPFVLRFRALYRRRGWITFDGLLTGARDLVRDHPAVRESLKRRFGALLIDEFQDTDPLQGELLLLLGERPGKRAKKWQEVEVEGGKLFIVGDPKQSIYRFRGADIAAVESFTAHLSGQGAARCSLQTNFRSQAGIIEAINKVFDGVMVPRPGLQPPYLPIFAAPKSPRGESPQWLQIAPPKSEPMRRVPAGESRRTEAAWIARWIQDGRGEHALRDIAIVLRSTSSLSTYLEALKRAKIPYVVEGEKYFYGTQEVVDFLNLLRAVDDPTDRVALGGLLRSPLAALEDAEIYALARRGRLDYRKNVGAVSKLFASLRRLHAMAGRMPLGDLVAQALSETRLIELCARAYHHQQTASNLMKFGRLAAEASDRGATLKEFIDWVGRSSRELREEGESPLADDDFDAVRILTIHKSKDLEYPVVILPNFSGRTSGRPPEGSVRVGWGGQAGVGLRLPSAGAGNAAMAILDAEEKRRQREEEVRVLYVAMTRPKGRLIILGTKASGADSLAARLVDSGGVKISELELGSVAQAAADNAGGAPPWNPPEAREFAKAWAERTKRARAAVAETLFTHPSGEHEHAGPAWRDDEDSPAAPYGAHLGRLAHETLERWDFKARRSLDGRDLEALVAERAAILARETLDLEAGPLAQEGEALLRGFLDSAMAGHLANCEILGREVPFLYNEGPRIVRGVIDLIYRAGKRLVVADYKTDRIRPGRGGKLDLAERYASQGRAYVEAVKRALGETNVVFEIIALRAPD